MNRTRLFWTIAVGSLVSVSTVRAADLPKGTIAYETHVRPIFKKHCFHCHGEEEKPKGKLDLRTVKQMLIGGRSGPAIVAKHPDESPIWERVEADEMPEGNKKLSAAEKTILKQWIEQGTKTLRPEPDDPNQARFTVEERAHWAYQPVKNVTPPSGDLPHPIDRFIVGKLKSNGIASLSTEASKAVLIRRLTYDLLGLPPTPDEVSAFVKDTSPTAYETLVDRLLASPHYGERWGRHWLDVAGYAETDGNLMNDADRPDAWRYRDYVIRAINNDLPYNQFVQEQLAGDELLKRPIDPTDADSVQKLIATGFLRMAPDTTAQANTIVDRNQAVAETLKVVSGAILGTTIGCAQCHDHKYDPIPAEDYYRFRAVFDPAFDLAHWKKPAERQYDVTQPDELKETAKIEAKATVKEAELKKLKHERAKKIFAAELAKVKKDELESVTTAVATPEKKQSPEQVVLLKKYPTVKPVSYIESQFEVYDSKAHEQHKLLVAEITKIRATKPRPRLVMTVSENPKAIPESRLHARGDPEQPKKTVQPGDLTVLPISAAFKTPPIDPNAATTGRRLAYANYLTSGTHPLTARVIVNRIWAHHFGKGIVATPGDFGLNGDPPTHPELLDWLATDFVKHGWKIKRFHKLILTSATYRQMSKRTPELDRLDPDNRLLARMSLRRLDAESLRDTILAVSGELVTETYGPSVPIAEDGEGRAVIGRRKTNDGLFAGIESAAKQEFRRSIYLQSKRTLPFGMLETFDLPVMNPNCDIRRSSTVATQSLLLLNDSFTIHHADKLAERIMNEAKTEDAQIDRLYLLLYSERPTDAERERCQKFLVAQETLSKANPDSEWQKQLKKFPHSTRVRAIAILCQTLLCTNRCLYIQ